MPENILIIHFNGDKEATRISYKYIVDDGTDTNSFIQILDRSDRLVTINLNNANYWFFNEEELK